MIEKFEFSEGRNLGELSSSDIPAVLKLNKEICDAQVAPLSFISAALFFGMLLISSTFFLQSLDESYVPRILLERIVAAGRKVYPPVCAIIGGILGQVSDAVLK